MSINRKFRLLVSVCLIMSLFLFTGCAKKKVAQEQTAGSGQPKAGGIFRCALLDDPASLDPANFNEELGIQVGKELYDGLVDFDFKTNQVIPAHAEKWENIDNRVFIFHLKKGTKFHNGKEVTAEDFKYSFDRLLNPKTASEVAWLMQNVKGAAARLSDQAEGTEGLKVIDRYTLQITLEQPYTAFLTLLTHPGAGVVDKETVEKAGSAFAAAGATYDMVIGSGPFRLFQWTPKNMIKIVRSENYYGRKAWLEGIEFHIIPDETTTLNEFRTGSLDFIDRIPPGQKTVVEKEFPGQVLRNCMWDIEFYGFNMTRAPYKDNMKLRQALNYAIDREGIIKAVLEGNGEPAKGVLPPGMTEYDKNLKGYSYDPVKASALLAEAGFPGGKGLRELELAYNERETNRKIAEAIQAQLLKIGIRAKLKGMPLPVYKREVGTGNAGMFRLSYSADFQDADSIFYPLFSSKSGNFFHYANSEVDRILDEARAEKDPQKRVQMYRLAEQKIVDDAPIIWLFHSVRIYVKAKNVQGIETSPMNIIPLSRVWISG